MTQAVQIIRVIATKLGAAAVSLALLAYTSHALGAEGRGAIGVITALMSSALIAHGIFGGIALVQEVNETNNIDRAYSAGVISFAWAMLCASMAMIFIYFSSFTVLISNKWIFFITLSFCTSYLIASIALMQGNTVLYSLLQLIQNSINLILILLISLTDQISVKTFCISLISSQLISIMIYLYKCFNAKFIILKPIKFSILNDSARSLIKKGLLAQISNLLFFYISKSMIFVPQLYGDLKASGQISVAITLSESVSVVSASLALVLFAGMRNINSKDKSVKSTIQFVKISVLISFIFSLTIIFLPNIFYVLIFGQEFYNIKFIILSLFVYIVCEGASNVLMFYFSGKGVFKMNLYATLPAFLISVLLGVILFPIFGVVGGGISVSISAFVLLLILIFGFCKSNNVSLRMFLFGWSDIRGVTAAVNEMFRRRQ
jgi:O-antigen/teichoic acid export membrane protein